jgi:hypothetical protein
MGRYASRARVQTRISTPLVRGMHVRYWRLADFGIGITQNQLSVVKRDADVWGLSAYGSKWFLGMLHDGRQ